MRFVVLRNMLRKLRLLIIGLIMREVPLRRIDNYFLPLPENSCHEDYRAHCYITWKSRWLPKSHAKDLETFITNNDKYYFHFFDDNAQHSWMEKNFPNTRILEIYHAMKFPAAKSDIFRYAIVWKLGGTFFSINRLTYLPIAELIGKLDDFRLSFSHVSYERKTEFFAYPREYKGLSVIQYTVSAPPGNLVLSNALKLIEEKAPSYWNKKFEKVNRAIWELCGPYLLTDAVDKYLRDTGNELEVLGFDFKDSLWVPSGLEFRYLQSPSYMSFKNAIVLGD